jgi:alpha-pyrone synthase
VSQISSVYINRIETSVPQSDGHARFVQFLPKLVRDDRMMKIVGRLASKCQIEHRYSVLSPHEDPEQLDADGFFIPGQFASTARRMERYQKEALPLAAKAVSRVIENVKVDEISHLIITSCTGFYAPGLDLDLQKHFGLRTDLERSIIGFMGCYAAFNGMKAASHIVRSSPTSKVLLVNLELCSLHLQDYSDPEKILGFLQFADGCAASLISTEPRGLELDRFRAEVISDDAEMIRWNVGDTGFDMSLSMEVPNALARAIPGLLPRIMSADERKETRLWAIHPGGRSILDAVQAKIELTDEEMFFSRETLRKFGNMSSATIMFVLKSILDDPKSTGLGAAFAFGPGLTVESMIFRKDA